MIIHHTGNFLLERDLKWLTDMKKSNTYSRASSHYVIDRDGKIYHLVQDKDRAWHSGKSEWFVDHTNGIIHGMNDESIGVELVGDGNIQPFTDAQYDSLIQLAAFKRVEHNFLYPYFLGHEHISRSRKVDPGKHFSWNRLFIGVFKG